MLINIAIYDNESLNESWGTVLRYISQLARLLLFAGNLHTDNVFYPEEGGSGTYSGEKTVLPAPLSKRQSESSWLGSGLFYRANDAMDNAKSLEKKNAMIVCSRIEIDAIDRIFEKSVLLSDVGVRHLVQQVVRSMHICVCVNYPSTFIN